MRGILSVDGRSQVFAVALPVATRAGSMSEECRLELCAESIAPSRICAQLHGITALAMLTCTSALGAQAGGTKAGIASFGPSQAHTRPAHSCTG